MLLSPRVTHLPLLGAAEPEDDTFTIAGCCWARGRDTYHYWHCWVLLSLRARHLPLLTLLGATEPEGDTLSIADIAGCYWAWGWHIYDCWPCQVLSPRAIHLPLLTLLGATEPADDTLVSPSSDLKLLPEICCSIIPVTMVTYCDYHSTCSVPSTGELASSPTIGHNLHVVYTQILIGYHILSYWDPNI